jgi:hypothetical protein
MSFMQEAAEPLRLRHVAGPHGLCGRASALATHRRGLLRGRLRGWWRRTRQNSANGIRCGCRRPGFARGACRVPDRREKVVHLVEGFESPLGLELLATVHWIVARDHQVAEEDLFERVYAGLERKRQFSAHQIGLAWRTLAQGGWIASVGA